MFEIIKTTLFGSAVLVVVLFSLALLAGILIAAISYIPLWLFYVAIILFISYNVGAMIKDFSNG